RRADELRAARRFRLGMGGIDAQLPHQAAGPQRPDHGPALEAHVNREAGHEDPRAVVVQRVEGAGELVPLWMLRMPVANSKTAPPTSSSSDSRSSACAGL